MDMKIVQTYKQDKNKRYSNMVSKEKYIMFLDFKQLMYVCVCVCVCVFILKILHEIRIFILFVNYLFASM